MLIRNPTPELMATWFCCGKRFARYLMQEHRLSPVHMKDGKVYFAKTEQLEKAVNDTNVLHRMFIKL